MKKVVAAAVLGCLLGVVDQALAEEFTIYGFVRFDAVIDDSRMQSHQFGFWVKPEPPDAEDDGNLTMYPRLTRLGVRFKPVKLDEVSTISGLVEVDFQNGGSESRQILRLRQAYFNLQRGDWHFLAGQAWDVISPIFPIANNDGLMWHAGNLGDRHPQVRLTFKPEGGVSLAVAAGQTGAVDRKDLDKNGILDGWDAALPFLQARLGLELPKFKAGAWAHWGAEETGAPVGGDNKTRFTSAAVGLDASISLTDKLTVQGEGWTGRNLTDIRGGIGQGVNTSTGEEIASTGGWAQVVVIPNAQWKLYAGATMEQPHEEAVPDGGRTRNGAYAACAAFARDAVDLGLHVPIANLSFVGSENLLQLLSEGRDDAETYTRFLVNSQVVPSYEDTSIPAVREYRELMARYNPAVPEELVKEPYSPFLHSFVSLEGFLDAKLMTEVLRRLGDNPNRSGLEEAVFSVRNFDLGIGEKVSFGPDRRQGLQTVYYTVVQDGRFVTLDDWESWLS